MPLKRENRQRRQTRISTKLRLRGDEIYGRDPYAPAIEPLVVRPLHAARLMGVSERSVWYLIAKSKLRVSRIGSMTMVHLASIRELLDQTAN